MRFKSKNPKSYIFVICQTEDGWIAAITPESHFAKEGNLSDQHFAYCPEKWDCMMESCFGLIEEEAGNLTPEQMHDDLVAQGVVFSADLADFMLKHGATQVVRQGTPIS